MHVLLMMMAAALGLGILTAQKDEGIAPSEKAADRITESVAGILVACFLCGIPAFLLAVWIYPESGRKCVLLMFALFLLFFIPTVWFGRRFWRG